MKIRSEKLKSRKFECEWEKRTSSKAIGGVFFVEDELSQWISSMMVGTGLTTRREGGRRKDLLFVTIGTLTSYCATPPTTSEESFLLCNAINGGRAWVVFRQRGIHRVGM